MPIADQYTTLASEIFSTHQKWKISRMMRKIMKGQEWKTKSQEWIVTTTKV